MFKMVRLSSCDENARDWGVVSEISSAGRASIYRGLCQVVFERGPVLADAILLVWWLALVSRTDRRFLHLFVPRGSIIDIQVLRILINQRLK